VRQVLRLGRILTAASVPFALAATITGTGALAATKPATTKPATTKAPTKVVSRHLWATIDACNPPDKKNMLGIRGSMPGTGRKDEKMYMRFRMQYESAGDTGFRLVGAATFKARQSGFYFSIPPVAGTSYVLRGAVNFEWRKHATVELRAQAFTTAGHISVAGADPKGYSAAACKLT
jgi:hypothetical protein